MATIKDVAERAGVSPITASRALNNPAVVQPKTIAKVKAAARELGYEPSRIAQSLRTGQTRIITLVVRQKDTYDPLTFEFATGISEACRANGYSLLIYPFTHPEHVDDLLGKVDGIVLTDIKDQDVRIEELHSKISIALFGVSDCDVPQIDIDDIWGTQLATEHLLSLGYKDIVFITSDTDYLFLRHREEGYVRTMKSRRLEPVIVYDDFNIAGGYHAMRSLPSLPEAVVCGSDSMALGVLRFLQECGQQLPVVGYDGGYLTDMTTPTLTSVRQPFFTAGVRLAEAMIQYMRTGHVQREVIKPELAVKDSTWPKGATPPWHRIPSQNNR